MALGADLRLGRIKGGTAKHNGENWAVNDIHNLLHSHIKTRCAHEREARDHVERFVYTWVRDSYLELALGICI